MNVMKVATTLADHEALPGYDGWIESCKCGEWEFDHKSRIPSWNQWVGHAAPLLAD